MIAGYLACTARRSLPPQNHEALAGGLHVCCSAIYFPMHDCTMALSPKHSLEEPSIACWAGAACLVLLSGHCSMMAAG